MADRWSRLSRALTEREARALAAQISREISTPAEAAEVIGAARARELMPAGCGWHDTPAPSRVLEAWRVRVAEVALFRWEAARRAQILADVALEAEEALAARLEAAGVRAPGPTGSVALRGALVAVWRREEIW